MIPSRARSARRCVFAGLVLLSGSASAQTAGPTITFNLMQLFQQQYKIFGSFGASIRNIRDSLAKMANGLLPVIDTELGLADLERGIARLESRQVFGKIVVKF